MRAPVGPKETAAYGAGKKQNIESGSKGKHYTARRADIAGR